jgi:DNA-binding CsgD family transcriptional regulator
MHELPSLIEVQHWARVMAHVSNAWRLHRDLRNRGGGPLDAADAVLAPNGAMLDAEAPEAKDPEARAELSAAAIAIERRSTARGRASQSPERILAERLALVAGRWSLVDEYDSDGKRFVVARRNDEGATVPALSDRQHQIAVHLARGHSNKLIAYQLGISIGTVTTHVRRLSQKLETGNRVQLVAACQMLAAFDPMSSPE